MKICLSRFWYSGIVAQDTQSWKDATIIGWFTTVTMIKYFSILGLIAALVPTAMPSLSVYADAEIGSLSGIPFDSDGLSISDNGDDAKMELKATKESHEHSTDYFSEGEVPLFGGSISDGDRNSERSSESFSPPPQREQTDEVNTLDGEEGSREGTPVVFIDPASSDSPTILSHRISSDDILDDPTMDINGEIQNNGTRTLDFVKVTATFYDTTNSVLGSDFTYTDPNTVESGQSVPFKLTSGFGDDLPIDEISSIKLHVDGD